MCLSVRHYIRLIIILQNEEGDFTVPYDAELECKQNVVVYDSNTSTLREEGLFTSFCFVHRIFSFWSVVIMFV